MKAIFYLFIGLILLSCSKNDTGTSGQKQLLLKKYYYDGRLETEYEYYEDNRLKSEIHFKADETTILALIIYEYSGDTIWYSYYDESNELISTTKMVLNRELLRREWYDNENQLAGYWVYINNYDPCGFSGVDYYYAGDSLSGRSVNEYFDSNCSVKQYEYNSENQLKSVNESIMDGKNNCFKSTAVFRSYKNGNITERISRTPYAINKGGTYNSTFEYNSDNYPISETRVFLYGLVVNYEFEYY